MKLPFSIFRNYLRPVSQVVLIFVISWLALPESQSFPNHLETKIYKSAEQAIIQIAAFKNKAENASFRDLHYTLNEWYSTASRNIGTKLTIQFLLVGSFERNIFYVNTTINAP